MQEQKQCTAYFIGGEPEHIIKPVQWSNVTELIVKTDISKTTYRNLKEVTILMFQDDIRER